MKPANDILKSMLLTEKASGLSANLNKYTFEIGRGANKASVANAVAKTFNVKVHSVNVVNVKPRPKRSVRGGKAYSQAFKKAIVTLREGEKIEMA
jgi:large subunit ribosomal protein L23